MFATDMQGPNEGPPTLWRWTVDTAAGVVKEEQLDDTPIEFPRVDERVVGRPHRYGWGGGSSEGRSSLQGCRSRSRPKVAFAQVRAYVRRRRPATRLELAGSSRLLQEWSQDVDVSPD